MVSATVGNETKHPGSNSAKVSERRVASKGNDWLFGLSKHCQAHLSLFIWEWLTRRDILLWPGLDEALPPEVISAREMHSQLDSQLQRHGSICLVG